MKYSRKEARGWNNKLEQENLRRFQIKTNDTELLSEAENVLQKHQLSPRELAVILEALAVQSGFSYQDFDK